MEEKVTILARRKSIQIVFDYAMDLKIPFQVSARGISVDEFEIDLTINGIKQTVALGMFVKEHKPKEKILVKMAEIIDGADTANDILPPLEAYGLEAICIGIRAGCETDLEAIEKSGVVFDGLYEYLKGR